MTKRKIIGCLALFAALTLPAMNPAAAADRKTTNTIIGAGIGAAAGAVLTQGDTLATLGGAAAGGLLGNILTEDRRDKRHYNARSSSRHHHKVKHHHHHKKVKHHYHKKAKHHHARKHYSHPRSYTGPRYQHVRADASRGHSRHYHR